MSRQLTHGLVSKIRDAFLVWRRNTKYGISNALISYCHKVIFRSPKSQMVQVACVKTSLPQLMKGGECVISATSTILKIRLIFGGLFCVRVSSKGLTLETLSLSFCAGKLTLLTCLMNQIFMFYFNWRLFKIQKLYEIIYCMKERDDKVHISWKTWNGVDIHWRTKVISENLVYHGGW